MSFNYLRFVVFFAPIASVISGLILAPFLITLGAICFRTPIKESCKTRHSIIAIIFLLCGLLSLFYSINVVYSFQLWLKICALFIFWLLVTNTFASLEKEQRIILSKAVISGFFVSLVLFIEEAYTSGFVARQVSYIVSFGESNSFQMYDMNRGACFIVLVFWICVIAISISLKCYRKFAIILLWISTTAILLNLESLSAVFSFLASSIAFVIARVFNGKLIRLVSIITFVVMCSVPYIMLHINPATIESTYSGLPASASHRLYIWSFTAKNASERSFTGWGIGSSRYIPHAKDVIDGKDGAVNLPLHPHNSILQIWLELGVTGVAVFILFVISIMFTIAKMKVPVTIKAAMTAIVVAYLSTGMLGFGFWQPWWISAGLLSSCFATSLLPRQEDWQACKTV